MVPATVLLVGMLPLPESPRRLAGQHRRNEARAVLGRVREDEARINEAMEAIEEAENPEEAGWRELLQP